ncbi:MAG: bacteriohemerythrin [Proteobacteria bacterium]|nr:bacteriohemerythrin [Pseudomonadota bacterium]NOG61553.1 bacteriohemerythrin [Pseudomonadota bacterium]
MGRNLIMLGMAILVMTLITFIIAGFMSGISNPLAWLSLVSLIIVIVGHNKLVKRRYLIWKDSYSVGIESIDNDHKKLIHLINNLQTAIDFKTDVNFEKQTLDEVINYTQYHFTREEGLMEDNGYPEFEPHKATHKKMIDQVNELVQAYEKGEDGAIESLLTFLKTWLIKHINGTDQEYSEYLISKGVK